MNIKEPLLELLSKLTESFIYGSVFVVLAIFGAGIFLFIFVTSIDVAYAMAFDLPITTWLKIKASIAALIFVCIQGMILKITS